MSNQRGPVWPNGAKPRPIEPPQTPRENPKPGQSPPEKAGDPSI
jgi:hypothetical protein